MAASAASDQQVLASTGVGSNQFLATTTDATSILRGAVAGAGGSSTTIRTTNQRLSSNSDLIVLMDSDLNIDRSHIFKSDGRLNSDLSGYIHAYGWSLPASSVRTLTSSKSSTAIGQSSVDNSSLHRGANGAGNILGGTSSYLAGTNSDTFTSINQSGLMDANATFNSVQGNKLSGLQVPIPQYCRPLTGDSLGMKIWCATAIDLSGGYNAPAAAGIEQPANESTRAEALDTNEAESSGSVVNISTSTPVKSSNSNQQQQALKQLEKEVDEALKDDQHHNSRMLPNSPTSKLPMLKTTTEMVLSALPMADDAEELSSCVWICSTQHSRSKITIIDIKTKPNELLDSFYVPTFLYSIKSIPGCKQSDLPGIISLDKSSNDELSQKVSTTLSMISELISTQKREYYRLVKVDLEAENKLKSSRLQAAKAAAPTNKKSQQTTDLDSGADNESIDQNQSLSLEQETDAVMNAANAKAAAATATTTANSASKGIKPQKPVVVEEDAEISRILDNDVSVGVATLQKLNDFVAHIQPEISTEIATDASNPEEKFVYEKIINSNNRDNYQDVIYYQPISTSLSTVWMGGKDSVLYIHSAIGQWKDCVACVKLPDSILQICHFRGKVFVALADGSLCVFFRNITTKQWEFSQYLLMDINLMADATNDSVNLESTSQTRTIPTTTITVNTTTTTTPTSSTSTATATNAGLETTTTSNNTGIAHDTTSATSTPTKQLSSELNKSTTKLPRAKVAGIRCLEIANRNLWVGYKNRVLIIDPITLKLKHSFNVVPQVDNQIRQLISMKDGVFVCLRSDLILRLYSSIKPYQHIQNIDIEPVVTRLISPKTFVISHITAMKVADNTLWIGNAHGIILTIPCKLVPQISETPLVGPNGEQFEETPSSLSIARFVPKCDITNAQVCIFFFLLYKFEPFLT